MHPLSRYSTILRTLPRALEILRSLLWVMCCTSWLVSPVWAGDSVKASKPGKSDSAFAAEGSPGEELRIYLDAYPDITSNFTQTTYARGESIAVEGRLWVSAPDKFKIETGDPVSQILVSNGKNFWNYDVELESVTVSKLDISQAPIFFLLKQETDLSQSYFVDAFSDEESRVFILTPKSEDSQLKFLNVKFVHKKLVSLLGKDNMGQSHHYVFKSLKKLHSPDQKLFTFTPPPGVDVLGED